MSFFFYPQHKGTIIRNCSFQFRHTSSQQNRHRNLEQVDCKNQFGVVETHVTYMLHRCSMYVLCMSCCICVVYIIHVSQYTCYMYLIYVMYYMCDICCIYVLLAYIVYILYICIFLGLFIQQIGSSCISGCYAGIYLISCIL